MKTINMLHCGYTTLPNAFIDNYLPKANPTFTVIYLYFYRHCLSGVCAITTAAAAEIFGILETDIVNCLKYWEKTGLIRLTGSGDECSIEFLPVEPEVPEEKTVSVKPVILETRPVYTVDELEIYKTESAEVARLFRAAEQAFGKLLHYNDLNVLFGIYDWLRLPLGVIERLLRYCADNDRLNMRYIEKVAIDWAERGILTLEAAEEYIGTISNDYREIAKALGRGGRAPTAGEIKYMDKWLRDYAMPLAVVLEACDRTIMHTGQGKLPYCDKIITEWHKKGVATLEEANRATQEPPTKRPAAKTRFANFKQREWDFDQIERAERAYLEAEGKAL